MAGLEGQVTHFNHFKTVEFAAGFVLALNPFKVEFIIHRYIS